jgi:hypothetical protein
MSWYSMIHYFIAGYIIHVWHDISSVFKDACYDSVHNGQTLRNK